MKKKNTTWMKPRHTLVRNIAGPILCPFIKTKYHITIEKLEYIKGKSYLILSNHQTGFDQFFLGLSYDGPIYYLATEDIFSLGWISRLLSYLIAPIPIKKQTTDLNAIKNCVKVAKEGGTIALFPEGNRTFHGKTLFFKPSIVKFIRLIKLPVVIMRIEGGYGVHPRWSDVVRKGTMKIYPTKIIEPEEYKNLSDEDFFAILQKELHVDENHFNSVFYHKKNAEYMERFLYVCPDCGLTVFKSHNDLVECDKCHRVIQYLPNKQLKGVDREFPFSTIGEWYDYQCNFISHLDLQPYYEKPIYQDEVKLFHVILYKNKKKLKNKTSLCLYGNHITIDDKKLDFDSIHSISVLGKNKINIYTESLVYQIKGNKSFNAVKYVNIYYHYLNTQKGEKNDEQFLGF